MQVTREKIKFVYGKDGLAELQAAIDPEVGPLTSVDAA